MTSWTSEWNVRHGRPRGSIELPVGDVDLDLKAWSRQVAQGLLGADAGRRQVKELARALSEATLDSRKRGPISATFFCPDPSLGELARIEVLDYRPDQEYPEITLRMLADWLSFPTPQSVRPAEVEYTDLPIGPAVRVRHQYVEAAGGDDGLGAIMQTCAYAVRPEQIEGAVLLMASWRALAYSDRLFELTDTIAGMLRLERK